MQKVKDHFSIVIAMLALGAVCLPVLLTPFAYNDDYYYFMYDGHWQPTHHPQFSFMLLIGRILYLPIMWIMSLFLWRIDDFGEIRLVGLFLAFIVGWLIYRSARKIGFSQNLSSFLCFSILTLPGFLIHLVWVSMTPFLISMIAALAAGHLYFYKNDWGCHRTLAFLALLTSPFIYQPTAKHFLLISLLMLFRWIHEPRDLAPRPAESHYFLPLIC